jgi:hypothetical protein
MGNAVPLELFRSLATTNIKQSATFK